MDVKFGASLIKLMLWTRGLVLHINQGSAGRMSIGFAKENGSGRTPPISKKHNGDLRKRPGGVGGGAGGVDVLVKRTATMTEGKQTTR